MQSKEAWERNKKGKISLLQVHLKEVCKNILSDIPRKKAPILKAGSLK